MDQSDVQPQSSKLQISNIIQFLLILVFTLIVISCIISIVILVTFLYENSVDIRLLKYPNGFKAQLKLKDLSKPRQLAFSPRGTLFIGTCSDKVYALQANKTSPITLLSNLTCPAGVAFFENNLYILLNNTLLRYDNIERDFQNPPQPRVIYDGISNSTYPKYIKISPTKEIFISIGTNCDSCISNDTNSATIAKMALDGSNFTILARGVRNSGFDWDPNRQDLWFTDTGKDTTSQEYPPDELNKISKDQQGGHYGFPYCYGRSLDIKDSGFNCTKDFIQPVYELPAHVTPLGMAFFKGGMFPFEYSSSFFFTEHGSNKLSESVGYRVMRYNLNDSSYNVFIDGWLSYNVFFGRPTDLIFSNDGSLYVSDDYSGSIYVFTYSTQ